MINPEQAAKLPFEAARRAGEAILWVTEHLVPPEATIETRAASITIHSALERRNDE